jgi:uncharacterized sulfatase
MFKFIQLDKEHAMSGETDPATEPHARAVVLFITDTTRWDMLGCYRDSGVRTPRLDRLAEEGMRFERAYTGSPVCGPARAALMTGTWPHANGGWANSMPLGTTSRSLGQLVSDHGVHAAHVGKWHLDGTDYFGDGRCPDGWDREFWYDGRNYLEEHSLDDRQRSRQWASSGAVESEFTFAHRCSDRAISFLERHHDEPFVLVVSYDEPHGPSISPVPFAHAYDEFEFPAGPNVYDSLADKPEPHRLWADGSPLGRRDGEEVRIKFPPFFAAQSYVDAQIGRVLDAVDRWCPDAVVAYTSDHGDALGSHRLVGKGPVMYDEVARIPLLIRWPDVTPAGSVCEHPVSHIDFVPTVLDALGIPAPPVLDGASLMPTLRRPETRISPYVFCEFGRQEIDHDGMGGFQPMRAVFDGRFKLVVHLLDTDELYDLDSDPGEMINLIDAPEHVADRNRLHDRLLDWMHETRDPFRGYHWERRPWRADAAPASWAGRGMTRQREEDGTLPRGLDYDTGLPYTEAVRVKQRPMP